MRASLRLLFFFQKAGSAAIAAGALTGCSQQTIDSATHDAAHDAQIVQREAKRAERKAEPDLKKLDIGARVTIALKANQNLPPTIRVDASDTGVTLRGTVDSEEQRSLAAHIARATLAEKYSVTSDLKLKGQ